MHGLVSLLPQPFTGKVEALWDELETEFGLRGVRVTPYPHFSWQIARDYPIEALEAALRSLAVDLTPIAARTSGLGIFTGEQPVLYIQVVRSPALAELHARVWDAIQPVARDLSPYYGPNYWMPHISLAYLDLNRENIGAVMQRLAFRSYNWEFSIDHIAFIYEPDGATGALRLQVPFGRAAGPD